MRSKPVFIAAVVIVLSATGAYVMERDRPPGDRGRIAAETRGVPVVAAAVTQQDVPIYLNGLGTVVAYNTVAIRSHVDGTIQQVLFNEGQHVKVGDLLIQIDARPYQANADQMVANRMRDQAQLANARLDLVRYAALTPSGFSPRQTLDTQKALVAQLEAQVASDQAQFESARTQLDYTSIVSPIDGETGIRQIDVGNIVHAADTTSIVVVTQMQPISVVFTLPADDLPQVVHGLSSGPLQVAALSQDGDHPLAEGQLEVIDNEIDPTTGMVKLKAVFANRDRALWPGQFVHARLLVSTQPNGLTAPAAAVQRGPDGSYAWVIRDDSTVVMRPVQTTLIQDDQVMIDRGLAEGERVVVDGQFKLQPDSRVEVRTAVAAAGPT